jgi:Fe-S-cluster containining protein
MKIEANCISQKTSKKVEEFTEKIEGFEPYVYRMKKTEKGKCVFLDGNLCTVYSIRPLICRFYPFEFKSSSNNRRTFAYTRECPGIGKGSKHEKKFFEMLFAELRKQVNKNLSIA